MSTNPTHWQQLADAPLPGALLGHLQEIGDGQVRMLVWENRFPYLLLRSGSTVRAYVNRCTHFGVPLAQKQEQLLFEPHRRITCNVHYARFDWDSGRCLGGDCDGEGLLPIPVAVDAQGHITIASA